mmetsp:Transcript_16452/g.31945  ORF Transcript_16452/g.31945 Transcript_16452/m.31945 type:complete len:123 (+) Transcript_16452:364-732(+)
MMTRSYALCSCSLGICPKTLRPQKPFWSQEHSWKRKMKLTPDLVEKFVENVEVLANVLTRHKEKKLGGLGKNNKRGQNFKNSSHDLRDEHSSDQSTMESPHTNSSSADMGQIQVFMSMWNVK